MYLIDKDKILTPELLQKYINNFVLNVQPRLKKWENYYNGKHAILNKSYVDTTKPCNRIVTNYCKVIVDTYNGYICGKPVSYSSNSDISDVQDVINYNDSSEDNELLKDALVYGVAYELHYLDEQAQERFTRINPVNALSIYSNDLNRELLYFVRWYPQDEIDNSNSKYYCDVYTADSVITYTMDNQLGNLTLTIEVPHHFHQCPVTVFSLNENETNIFDSIISLNDAYNELQSAEIDDYQAFVDAYMVLDIDADDEEIAKMRENRVLLLPQGNTASYLTKQTNDTQIQNMLDNIKKNIFKITAAPDLSDESFLAQSGVSLLYKLTGFENSASNIVANMTKALQRRIELICEILNLKATEATWRDINITFVRNLPNDYTTVINLVNSLQGIVSNKTLLSLLPFVKDVDAEVEAVAKQKQESMDMFGFTDNHTNAVEDEEDEQ